MDEKYNAKSSLNYVGSIAPTVLYFSVFKKVALGIDFQNGQLMEPCVSAVRAHIEAVLLGQRITEKVLALQSIYFSHVSNEYI